MFMFSSGNCSYYFVIYESCLDLEILKTRKHGLDRFQLFDETVTSPDPNLISCSRPVSSSAVVVCST
ncbi:hypothetical protein NQ315_001528 [Exocentrus adspersus]|uniref:Uncharacterized protein n=1 Tax=Exocentrus adspersus TaxID=1586481 RepID=A0AAV8W9S4_9CUCU|nr:hypothetical protein NQ315_001528 [Exocentrus adspersus]